MTNREAFNRYVREEIAKQVIAMENMSNEELVRYAAENPGYVIKLNILDAIGCFKANSAGGPAGDQHTFIIWMDTERTIDEEKRWQSFEEWNSKRKERNNARRPEE